MSVKRFMMIVAGSMLSFAAMAVPPKPGYIDVAQPDGSTFKARIVGNEHFHYYLTVDGKYMVADVTDGFYKPAAIDASGKVVAAATDKLAKTAFTTEEFDRAARFTLDSRTEAVRAKAARVAPGGIKRDFPTTGKVRGLIVLAEYQDVKFQPEATREYFDTKINQPNFTAPETFGSVNDYFKEQSGGVFTPEFDVVGPITLPHERSWYGLEEKLDDLFRDAAKAAEEKGVDFTRYDVNNDFTVDFFFVIFAGHGEAQGGPAECIWPAMKDITYFVTESFGGMYLGVAACSCELRGGEGTRLDGVSTICHEFSHILGLPDVYDAMETGGYGMGHYDMMCYGPYNDDGRTPCSYTAMEKYTLGWIEPTVLDAPQENVTLGNFNTTNDCVFIVNPETPNEYYTVENRQQVGFDSGLPGHGLVISYIHYDRSIWKKNAVNSPSLSRYERVSIIPADNVRYMDETSEAADTWPGAMGKTEFTDNTQPAAIWQSSKKPVGKPITNIRENADGTVSFDFDCSAFVAEIAEDAEGAKAYYNLQGIEVPAASLTPGVYIVREASGNTSKTVIR